MRWTEQERGREEERQTEKVTERETDSDVTLSREWTLVDTVTFTHSHIHTRPLQNATEKEKAIQIHGTVFQKDFIA